MKCSERDQTLIVTPTRLGMSSVGLVVPRLLAKARMKNQPSGKRAKRMAFYASNRRKSAGRASLSEIVRLTKEIGQEL